MSDDPTLSRAQAIKAALWSAAMSVRDFFTADVRDVEAPRAIGRDLPAIHVQHLTACTDCGNVYYLAITEECPVCGSTENLSPKTNRGEAE